LEVIDLSGNPIFGADKEGVRLKCIKVKLMLLKDVMEQNNVLKQISLANTNLNVEG
jgi:hypothetical protein